MIPSIEARRRGGRVRAQAFTPAYQSWARGFVSREACARNGRKGARVTLERYGAAFLHERLRAWRLGHPSSLERRVIDPLAELGQREGLDYAREYRPLGGDVPLTVDFCWPERRLVLEVDGPVHALFGNEVRRRREEARLARLRAAGWRIVALHPDELGGAAAAVLAGRLGLPITSVAGRAA